MFQRISIDIQKTLLQKLYELFLGTQIHTVDVIVTNRQFDWLEISFGLRQEQQTSNYLQQL